MLCFPSDSCSHGLIVPDHSGHSNCADPLLVVAILSHSTDESAFKYVEVWLTTWAVTSSIAITWWDGVLVTSTVVVHGHVAEIKSYLPLFARQSDACMSTSLDFWQVSTLYHDLWGPGGIGHTLSVQDTLLT